VSVDDVLARVKVEVGLYHQYEIEHAKDKPLADACKGYVNLQITKVQMTLTTMKLATNEVDPKIGFPLPTGFTLGISASGSAAKKGTQTMTFAMFPLAEQTDKQEFAVDVSALKDTPTPLRDALIGLREALLRQSDRKPCFQYRVDDSDVKNTVSFLMDIEHKGSIGINFAYTIFGITGSHSVDNDYSNKIEITFEPYLNPLGKDGKPPKAPKPPRPPYTGEGFTQGKHDLHRLIPRF